jgi:hypothetical protein
MVNLEQTEELFRTGVGLTQKIVFLFSNKGYKGCSAKFNHKNGFKII